MATRTRTTNRVSTPATIVYTSKSAHVRALLDQGKTIAEITKLVPNMGYAFAYGIAKRYGKTETAAHRRQPKGSKFSAIVKFILPAATDAQVEQVIKEFTAEAAPSFKATVKFTRVRAR